MPETHGAESYVEVAESDPEQAHPSAEHMAAVQAAHAGVAFGAHRCFSKSHPGSRRSNGGGNGNQTCSCPAAGNVERQDDRANPNSEML